LSSNFHENLGHREVALPSDRSTGLVFAGAALVLAIFYRSSPAALYYGLAISAVLAFIAFVFPRLLGPLNVVWFAIGKVLHAIVSPLTLGVLFFLIVAPFGFIMRLFRDPLMAAPPDGSTSFWIERDVSAAIFPPDSMKNQF